MSDKNIYQRLSAITAELPIVAKNLFVETSKDKEKGYRAVSEADILNAVKPLEIKYGVYSYPVSRELVDDEILQSETQYGTKTTFFTRIKTTYRFVNLDDPADYIETVTYSEGIDSQDKGSGKGMTYGDKYALMKAYKITTGDDPDKDASIEASYTTVNTRTCSSCGETITDKVSSYSVKRYGKPLCMECQKKNDYRGVATPQRGDNN